MRWVQCIEGLNPLEFKIEDVINNVSFKKGDTIISGGMSSYFPYGIPLGGVVDFESNSQNGYYTINARLFEDPSLVNYVYILTNEDKKEIKQLQENFRMNRKNGSFNIIYYTFIFPSFVFNNMNIFGFINQ